MHEFYDLEIQVIHRSNTYKYMSLYDLGFDS